MTIEVGSIKTFTLITGMEIIGKVTSVDDAVYSIEKAFAVNVEPQPDGSFGVRVSLAQLSPFETGGVDLELYKYTILISTNPPEGLVEQYKTTTGSIVTPITKKIQLPS